MDVEGRRLNRRWMDSVNDWTVRGRNSKSGCVAATSQKHQPHIEAGKDAMEEEVEEDYNNVKST